jgi:hypothetical protein
MCRRIIALAGHGLWLVFRYFCQYVKMLLQVQVWQGGGDGFQIVFAHCFDSQNNQCAARRGTPSPEKQTKSPPYFGILLSCSPKIMLFIYLSHDENFYQTFIPGSF